MHRFLSELPSNKARASATVIAWGFLFISPLAIESLQPGGFLLVAEEGTRWGYHLVRCARSLILRMETPTELSEIINGMIPTPDVEIIAPCAHCKECSLKGNKAQWCHFAQQCEAGPTAVGFHCEHFTLGI